MLYIVWAESDDWCGCISNYLLIEAESEDDAIAIAILKSRAEDDVRDLYTSDEEDEDYIEEPSISFHAEEYEEEMHGSKEEYERVV